jgi:Ca-activated chloride channel homolog
MRLPGISAGVGFCLMIGGWLSPSSGQETTSSESPATTVAVTVTDRQHNLVNDLEALHFKLYEDDQLQTISTFNKSDVPVCMGLVVDASGSMRPKHASVSAAMLDLVKAGRPQDSVFVVNFNDRPYLDQDFTRDPEKIRQALARGDPRGGTALYDAVVASSDHLTRAGGCQKRVLVVVTDGEDNESRLSLEKMIEGLRGPRAPTVYAIALPDPRSFSRIVRARRALEELTAATGGAPFFLGKPADMDKAVSKVAEEIRHQYILTYVPAGSQYPGSFRKIRVLVEAGGRTDFVVRVRSGVKSEAQPGSVAGPTSRP